MGRWRSVGSKGLSPVIASILMILLVIFLAAIVFSWGRGFLSEQIEKFGKPIEETCASVNLNIDVVFDGGYHVLYVSNRGNVGVSALEIKMYSEGESEVIDLDMKVFAGESVIGEASLGVMSNGDIPERVEVFPVLSGFVAGESSIRKSIVCYDNPIVLDI